MLIRRTLRTMPGQVGGPLLQLAGTVVFTHYLGPAALGIYALAWAAQELAYYGVVAWWSAYVQRYAADHGEGDALDRLNRAETAVLTAGGFIQAIVACLMLWLVTGEMSGALMVATALFTVSRNLATHLATRARAEQHDLAFTIIQLGAPGGGLLIGIAAFTLVRPDAETLIWAFAIAQIIAIGIALPLTGYRPSPPHIDRAMLRGSWTYGAPLVLANLLEWGANHGVRLIVDIGLGLAAVGLMTVAWWLGLRIATMAALAVGGALFADTLEKLRAHGHDAARARLADGSALILGILAPLTVGVALTAPALADLLVAAPYRETTAALLPFAMLAGALRAFREHGPEQALMLFERPGGTVVTTLTEALLTLSFCGIGLWLGGLTGAVAGSAAASLLAALVAAAYAARAVGYYLRLADLARIAVATALMTGAVLAIPPLGGLTGLAAATALGVLVYAAASALLWRGRLARPTIGARRPT